MNRKSFEYIVKAKNTQIEHDISGKLDFKLLIHCIMYVLVISIAIYFYNLYEIEKIIVIIFIIAIILRVGMEIKESILKLRKIKLEKNCIFINARNKEYKFSYEDLLNIGVAEKCRSRLLYHHYLYIYYLKYDEIEKVEFGIPKHEIKKIDEICSTFITNYNTERLNENEYNDIRTKEKDEIINKVFNDEIIW